MLQKRGNDFFLARSGGLQMIRRALPAGTRTHSRSEPTRSCRRARAPSTSGACRSRRVPPDQTVFIIVVVVTRSVQILLARLLLVCSSARLLVCSSARLLPPNQRASLKRAGTFFYERGCARDDHGQGGPFSVERLTMDLPFVCASKHTAKCRPCSSLGVLHEPA